LCEKYMSNAAKKNLVKSVVQAITTHTMSVLKFPAWLCDDLEKITRSFWWGYKEDNRKVPQMSWEKWLNPSVKEDLTFGTSASLIKPFLRNKHVDLSIFRDLVDMNFIRNTSTCWQRCFPWAWLPQERNDLVNQCRWKHQNLVWQVGATRQFKSHR
jgi:hypothetical protein